MHKNQFKKYSQLLQFQETYQDQCQGDAFELRIVQVSFLINTQCLEDTYRVHRGEKFGPKGYFQLQRFNIAFIRHITL